MMIRLLLLRLFSSLPAAREIGPSQDRVSEAPLSRDDARLLRRPAEELLPMILSLMQEDENPYQDKLPDYMDWWRQQPQSIVDEVIDDEIARKKSAVANAKWWAEAHECDIVNLEKLKQLAFRSRTSVFK
jgi:hypothetical protein